MIHKEIVTIHEQEYIRTWSDLGVMLQREDGAMYEEAIDPIDSGRAYAETDIPIVHEYDAEYQEQEVI